MVLLTDVLPRLAEHFLLVLDSILNSLLESSVVSALLHVLLLQVFDGLLLLLEFALHDSAFVHQSAELNLVLHEA